MAADFSGKNFLATEIIPLIVFFTALSSISDNFDLNESHILKCLLRTSSPNLTGDNLISRGI
jgi:hypothetical protein